MPPDLGDDDADVVLALAFVPSRLSRPPPPPLWSVGIPGALDDALPVATAALEFFPAVVGRALKVDGRNLGTYSYGVSLSTGQSVRESSVLVS